MRTAVLARGARTLSPHQTVGGARGGNAGPPTREAPQGLRSLCDCAPAAAVRYCTLAAVTPGPLTLGSILSTNSLSTWAQRHLCGPRKLASLVDSKVPWGPPGRFSAPGAPTPRSAASTLPRGLLVRAVETPWRGKRPPPPSPAARDIHRRSFR